MASHQNGGGNYNAPPSTGNPPLTLAQLQAQAQAQAYQQAVQMYYNQPPSYNQGAAYGYSSATNAPYGYPMGSNYNMMFSYQPQLAAQQSFGNNTVSPFSCHFISCHEK